MKDKSIFVDIIYHQAALRCQKKGILFGSLSIKEQYQIMYEVALDLLVDLGK